jgi:hypothetical protein
VVAMEEIYYSVAMRENRRYTTRGRGLLFSRDTKEGYYREMDKSMLDCPFVLFSKSLACAN